MRVSWGLGTCFPTNLLMWWYQEGGACSRWLHDTALSHRWAYCSCRGKLVHCTFPLWAVPKEGTIFEKEPYITVERGREERQGREERRKQNLECFFILTVMNTLIFLGRCFLSDSLLHNTEGLLNVILAPLTSSQFIWNQTASPWHATLQVSHPLLATLKSLLQPKMFIRFWKLRLSFRSLCYKCLWVDTARCFRQCLGKDKKNNEEHELLICPCSSVFVSNL